MQSATVWLKSSAVPTTPEWQAAINALGLPLRLDLVDPNVEGTFPCTVRDTIGSGFELYKSHGDPADAEPACLERVKDLDQVWAFFYRALDPLQEFCALGAAAGLLSKCGGLATLGGQEVTVSQLVECALRPCSGI